MAVLTDQREQIVRELTRHCGDGRLTLDELEERIDEAYAAEDLEALRHVLRELPPAVSPVGADRPHPAGRVLQARFALPPLPAVPGADEWERPVSVLLIIFAVVLLVSGMFWMAVLSASAGVALNRAGRG